MLFRIMDDIAALRAQLKTALQLNQELARANAKQASDMEALINAAQTLREDRDRLAQSQRELRQRVEQLEAINKQLTNMLWGRRSERREVDPNQTRLFAEPAGDEESDAITADDRAQEVIDQELIRQWERRRRRRRQKKAARGQETFPASQTGANRSRLAAMVQFMFFCEKVSDAAANRAISSTSAARALSRPFMFGTRTG